MSYQIRTFGDPVLASQAAAVTDIDGKIVRIVEEMFDTLYDNNDNEKPEKTLVVSDLKRMVIVVLTGDV